MRLPRPFYQLPLVVLAERLQAEVAALPDHAWAPHPDGIPGNSAVRLISAGGGENDAHDGDMAPTPWLAAMPGVGQVLASFGVVWSRSRLMRLAPGVDVPEHADIAHHWHTRVRLHLPITTDPRVRFHCDGETVHMAAGEAWIFDNWRRHRVENGASAERIHLVADTSGTAAFWNRVYAPAPPRADWPLIGADADAPAELLTECDQRSPVMPAAEVQALLDDLCADLAASSGGEGVAPRFARLLESFTRDWRQLCALHGTSGRGRAEFAALAARLRQIAPRLGQDLTMRSNGASAVLVLDKRVLQHLIADEPADRH